MHIHRFSKKYMIPCSMFCQVEKPNMMTYLLPLMKKFQFFQDEGMLPLNLVILCDSL